jgi:hypothetical protein
MLEYAERLLDKRELAGIVLLAGDRTLFAAAVGESSRQGNNRMCHECLTKLNARGIVLIVVTGCFALLRRHKKGIVKKLPGVLDFCRCTWYTSLCRQRHGLACGQTMTR